MIIHIIFFLSFLFTVLFDVVVSMIIVIFGDNLHDSCVALLHIVCCVYLTSA